jgi:hypothetical protein
VGRNNYSFCSDLANSHNYLLALFDFLWYNTFMTTRDSAGFAVAGGEAPQVVFAGQIEGALPFDSALLEARINKNRLH